MKFRTTSSKLCLAACLLSSVCCGLDNAVGQTINDPNYTLSLYLNVANAGNGGSATNDIALANGGAFGDDLFAADFGIFTAGDGNGRILRVTDSDNNGVGESSIFASAVGTPFTSPVSLTFGLGGSSPFGNDLYLMDYDGSTSQRLVYRVNSAGAVSQFTTTSIFNPDGLEAHPDGNRLLLNDASTFTTFGGGDDGTIFQVSSTGAISVWADGSNNPNGLWDINNEAVFSPDGWYTLSNHSVGAGNPREIIQFKDLNTDGDANDAGESRVLIGLGAPVGQQAGFAFDDMGNFYHSGGKNLFRYTDLNNDGDFWNASGNDFDTGERFLLAEDLGVSIKSMTYRNGVLYVGTNEPNLRTSIYRITVPEPSSVALLVTLLAAFAVNQRRVRS